MKRLAVLLVVAAALLAPATAARIAYCNSPVAVNDITCQVIRTAISSASTPRRCTAPPDPAPPEPLCPPTPEPPPEAPPEAA